MMESSQIIFSEKLPATARIAEVLGYSPEATLVIYDRRLSEQTPGIEKWLKNFSAVYNVKAGEKLKDLDDFPGHVKKIVKTLGEKAPRSRTCVVALGGGSIGDFAGFFASVFKRGVDLIHIPTTLLAAMDSAHGGKTALNLAEIKNQIGTFYPARAVFLIEELFQSLSKKQIRSGGGEMAKMAIVEGQDFFKDIITTELKDFQSLWRFVPQAIEAKNKIVAKDPFETTGERQVLNLGHTLGHILETQYEIPHGEAVGLGVWFSIEWSYHRGHLPANDRALAEKLLFENIVLPRPQEFFKSRRPLTRRRMERMLVQDKKLVDKENISFIFLDMIGSPFAKKISIESFLTEAERQGWIQ